MRAGEDAKWKEEVSCTREKRIKPRSSTPARQQVHQFRTKATIVVSSVVIIAVISSSHRSMMSVKMRRARVGRLSASADQAPLRRRYDVASSERSLWRV